MNKLVILLGVVGALVRAQAGGVYVSATVPVSPCYWDYSYPAYCYTYYPDYAYPAYPVYAYEYTRPNYAVGGTLLGALTGGLIGASQHHGWEGAGIGAAAGLVVGGIAEIAAEKHEEKVACAPVVVAPPPPLPVTVVTAPPPPPAAAPVPVYYSPYQIPNAPRVPDAPTF